MRRALFALRHILLAGNGRPVALVLLTALIALNVLSEIDRLSPERPSTADRVLTFFGAPFSGGRLLVFDGYQRLTPRQPKSNPVTIVAIDEKSLTAIGQWPWPRNRVARLIDSIAVHQPAAIGLDIYMPEEDQTSPGKVADNLSAGNAGLAASLRRLPSHENQLAAALRNSPSVLGAAGFDFRTFSTSSGLRTAPVAIKGADPTQFVHNYPWVLASLPELQAAAHGQAMLTVESDEGLVRRMPLVVAVNGQLVPGLAMEMLRVGTGTSAIEVTASTGGVEAVSVADLRVPTQPNGELWLHFSHGESGAARYVSAASVLAGVIPADFFTGKLVMIGLTGAGLTDQRTTALGERVPGIEIQAQLVESLFDGRLILRPWWMKTLETALLALMGALLIYLVPRSESMLAVALQTVPRAALGSMLILNLAVLAIGYLAFIYGGLLFDASATFIVLCSVLASLMLSTMIQVSRRNDALAKEQQVLREEAAQVAGELSAARRIQLGSLPQADLLFPREQRFKLAAFLEPAYDVGGDLYDFFMIDEQRLGFVIGDVSGKGLPASLFMAVTKTLTKTIAVHANSAPDVIARLTNSELARVNPEMLFVTLLVGVLDVITGQLTLVNAGHDGPWLISSGGGLDHLESPPEAGGPPLCMIDDFPYAAQTARLGAGDTLCLITDGVTEAMSPAGEIYGLKQLEAVLRTVANLPAQAVIERVRADVARHVGDARASDDITLLVIRWTPPAPTVL
jgi:adenylate cyclase